MRELSIPRSPSPVDWTPLPQLLFGHLPPITTFPTPPTSLTSQITHPLVFTSLAHQTDHTAQNLINHVVKSADPSAQNQEDRPIVAFVGKKQRRQPAPPPQTPFTSHREMRPSTTWGHYLHTQGGRVRDPLYTTSSTTRPHTRGVPKSKTIVATKKTTTTRSRKIPTQFRPLAAQITRLQTLSEDGRRLTRAQARAMSARPHPFPRGSS